MAQRSKKMHIVEAALPLFLEHGFKGTSIDMVVRAGEVSKPTVYNHFPDKAALMEAVLARWVDGHKPLIVPLRDRAGLEAYVREQWLTDEAVRLYAVVIGEGFRFPRARGIFWQQFDRLWRRALEYACAQSPEFESGEAVAYFDRCLLERLRHG